MYLRLLIVVVLLISVSSCSDSKLNQTKEFAGANWRELEKVLDHYKKSGDKQKYKAARFLISNMLYEKYSYEGDIIQKYDEILNIYESLRQDSVFVGDPPIINNTWDSIKNRYGEIDVAKLNRLYDCQILKADFLIRNIDIAFRAWEKSPYYKPEDFDIFCEYILPYRINNEPVEEYRLEYFERYKHIVDTANCVNNIVYGFHLELFWNQKYRASNKLWDHPLEFSISQMEIGHRGACRHLTTFETLVMRACGLPVTIDRAIWANRSVGHSWNVLLLDSAKILPFDALDRGKIEFAYKPAKIFRKKYSYDIDIYKSLNYSDFPKSLVKLNEIDVTNEYCQTYNISVPITYNRDKYSDKKYGVICVFDNKNWRTVYYGEIKAEVMTFDKMASDVAYIAAFYDNGKIIPASDPFLLKANGEIVFCKVENNQRIDLRLNRKFPRFKRIEDLAMGMRRTNIEGANHTNFKDSTLFFSIYDVPGQITDSFVNNSGKFRFFRFNSSTLRNANFAEVEFFGKKDFNSQEEKLAGKIIGFPPVKSDDAHPYIHAMDGNLETWFEKPKKSIGWVGLDLGKGVKRILTRVRFCPRSDTNFILIGDNYELLFWDGEWKSAGSQIANDTVVVFKNVPTETLYLLHNHTRGKEERIFTYENGKQVWW